MLSSQLNGFWRTIRRMQTQYIYSLYVISAMARYGRQSILLRELHGTWGAYTSMHNVAGVGRIMQKAQISWNEVDICGQGLAIGVCSVHASQSAESYKF